MLVQAPAGSGKTTLLAQRYLRLLAHGRCAGAHPGAHFHAPRRGGDARTRAAGAGRRAPRDLSGRHEPRRLGDWPWLRAGIWTPCISTSSASRRGCASRPSMPSMPGWPASCPYPPARASGFQVLADAQTLLRGGGPPRLGARGGGDRSAPPSIGLLALDDQRWRRLRQAHRRHAAEPRPLAAAAGGTAAGGERTGRGAAARVRQHLDEDLQLLVSRVLIRAARRHRRGKNGGAIAA